MWVVFLSGHWSGSVGVCPHKLGEQVLYANHALPTHWARRACWKLSTAACAHHMAAWGQSYSGTIFKTHHTIPFDS